MKEALPLTVLLAFLCQPAGAVDDAESRQAAFFAADVIQTIQLEVDPADLERLHAALPEQIYVPATFRWRDRVLDRVGVRYKGGSSARPEQRHKRSFLIKFPEYVKGQRFLGLRRVALDNGVQFGSLFSERIITDILREVGVTASRTNYARLTLNGKNLGVYVNVERIDRAFLENRLGDAEGVLYKVNDGGPGADLRYIGDDPLLYAKAFDIKAGKAEAQLADLVDFVRELRDTPDKELASHLRRVFEVDAFIWQMGVLLLAGAFDQYTGWGPHNYYLHREAETGRWRYLTWDLDVGFADRAFGRVPVLDGWHAAWPVPKTPRPLLERIVGDEELLALYRKRAKRLLETHFQPEKLEARLDRLYALVRDDLAKDPFPKGRVTNPSDRSYEDVITSMKEFIRRRYDTARGQLDRPGARPDPVRMERAPGRGRRPGGPRPGGPGSDGPRPGRASEDAPSELVVTRHDKSTVELSWKDNATGEGAVIVQRCEGADCETFENLKGVPGENVTSATDTRVEAGKTYRYRVYAVKPTPGGAFGTGVSNVVTVRIEPAGSAETGR